METEKKFKLYSQTAIAIATFLGAPLAAGILIRRNFLNLEKEKEGLMALILGIVSTFLIFWGIFAIPDSIIDNIPNALIPAIYTAIIFGIVEKTQGNALKTHKEEKNKFYSNWRATGIGFLCMVILIGGIFIYAHFAPDDWDIKTYDAKMENFDKNEEIALKLFEIPFDDFPAVAIRFIEQVGIPKWKENIKILNEIAEIENIPKIFLRQNELLLEYCKLRIETFELISQALLNETDEYDERIFKKLDRIDEIIKEIKIKFSNTAIFVDALK